ncbi:MAG TPA: hypothetical protein VFK89_02200 [Actinomycetota bacterium]|nr:hypothetical protein [Actinomycetota bacterium]
MTALRRRGPLARLSLALVMTVLVGGTPASAQTAADCTKPSSAPAEPFGPTDISAVTGNRSLSVGLNGSGTVTVLRWPSPSYYDQIKYETSDRSQDRDGALPNEGAFMGIAWRAGDGDPWDFAWLRDWTRSQRYGDDDGDEIVTKYVKADVGLRVVTHDVVASTNDAFVRRVSVTRTSASLARHVRLISFVNFNPVYSKRSQSPYGDWCREENNDEGASYDDTAEAIVATRSGIDESTGRPSSVALAMGFNSAPSGFEVGLDTYETGTAGTSAYDDAADGELSGVTVAPGQSDGALSTDLDLSSSVGGTATVIVAAGPTAEAATATLEHARDDGFGLVRGAKHRWWANWLRGARLPRGAPAPVTSLAKRALVSIRQVADPSGLIVASIASQPPDALDWVRHGLYINRALERAGHPEMVEAHDEQYADLQATTTSQPPGGTATPSGNWAQNYYADGVVGGPIPYAIDETGSGIYTLWDHYAQTGNGGYLLNVYEAIQRAAQYLTDVCRDPSDGLQCAAPEGDSASPTQTMRGAAAVWMGLDAASKAALARARIEKSGSDVARANAKRWAARRDEVGDAMKQRFFDRDCRCYPVAPDIGGTILWPGHLFGYSSRTAAAQARHNFRPVAAAMDGRASDGGDESQALLGNSLVWDAGRNRRKLRAALKWVARVPTTGGTRLLGEAWMHYPDEHGPVTTMAGQPFAPALAMFYLAALNAWGPTAWKP